LNPQAPVTPDIFPPKQAGGVEWHKSLGGPEKGEKGGPKEGTRRDEEKGQMGGSREGWQRDKGGTRDKGMR
jgi:hypothetical protein